MRPRPWPVAWPTPQGPPPTHCVCDSRTPLHIILLPCGVGAVWDQVLRVAGKARASCSVWGENQAWPWYGVDALVTSPHHQAMSARASLG